MLDQGFYPDGIWTAPSDDALKKDIELFDVETGVDHYQESDFELSHSVKISKESKLFEIIGKEEIMVNSYHKRCIGANDLFKISAVSDDGIVEAIESKDKKCIGVQFHPEKNFDKSLGCRKIFERFVKVCGSL